MRLKVARKRTIGLPGVVLFCCVDHQEGLPGLRCSPDTVEWLKREERGTLPGTHLLNTGEVFMRIQLDRVDGEKKTSWGWLRRETHFQAVNFSFGARGF